MLKIYKGKILLDQVDEVLFLRVEIEPTTVASTDTERCASTLQSKNIFRNFCEIDIENSYRNQYYNIKRIFYY